MPNFRKQARRETILAPWVFYGCQQPLFQPKTKPASSPGKLMEPGRAAQRRPRHGPAPRRRLRDDRRRRLHPEQGRHAGVGARHLLPPRGPRVRQDGSPYVWQHRHRGRLVSGKGKDKGKPFERRGRFTDAGIDLAGEWRCVAGEHLVPKTFVTTASASSRTTVNTYPTLQEAGILVRTLARNLTQGEKKKCLL